MSSYLVEEPDETPIRYNTFTNEEVIEYWQLYSDIQKKRFKKVLSQMRNIWFETYKTIKFVYDLEGIDNTNELMKKVHKIFIIQLNNKIEYYNEEKIRKRKQKNYIKNKINKIKNTKYNI